MDIENKLFRAFLVSETADGQFIPEIAERRISDLPAGDVLIRVHYSSLNYKDALSASGNKAVTRHYPHVPGVDAAGLVVASAVPEWQVGDQVIVTGFDLGMNTSGGFGQYIRVPAGWIVRLPLGLTLKQAMAYGTAGFTAALSVAALLHNNINPESGPVAVTGATGGVGAVAVAILSQLGYRVTGVSGKNNADAFLRDMGAAEVITRQEVDDRTGKALLKPRFAAAIDTVGGNMLATLLKSLAYGGTVTTCGMVNGGELATSVFPFILRGVKLAGIDSVLLPLAERHLIWANLAGPWRIEHLDALSQEITLTQLPDAIAQMLRGQSEGRTIVSLL